MPEFLAVPVGTLFVLVPPKVPRELDAQDSATMERDIAALFALTGKSWPSRT